MFKKVLLLFVAINFVGFNNCFATNSKKSSEPLLNENSKNQIERAKNAFSEAPSAEDEVEVFYQTDFKDLYINHGEEISVKYTFGNVTTDTIVKINYQGDGFTSNSNNYVSIYPIDNYVFSFNVLDSEQFVISINFEINEIIQTSEIYVKSINSIDYISLLSFVGCRQQEFMYLYDNDLISMEAYSQFVYDYEEEIEIIDARVTPNRPAPKRRVSHVTPGGGGGCTGGVAAENGCGGTGGGGGTPLPAGMIKVYGYVDWIDHEIIQVNGIDVDNEIIRPARNMTIEIWDGDPWYDPNDKVITTTTDNNGEYSVTFENKEGNGYDIYVKIVLGNEDFRIFDLNVDFNWDEGAIRGLPTYSYVIPEKWTNVPDGLPIMFGHTFDTGSGSARDEAVEVFQAATYGFEYMNMIGYGEKTFLQIQYPGLSVLPTSCYNFQMNIIHLKRANRSDWDTILHEFGHYVADRQNLSGYIAMTHRFSDQNQIPLLSWSEGWATYFSTIVQEKTSLRNLVPLIANTSNGQFSGRDIELDNAWLYGEWNEWVIARLLWDLQDEYNHHTDETFDKISWGHVELYRKIRNSAVNSRYGGLDTFSDFWKGLNISTKDLDAARILSHYEITAEPEKLILASVKLDNRPTFKWDSGYDGNISNSFYKLNIMKPNDQALLTINVGTNLKYTLSEAEWRTILNAGINYVKWNVSVERKGTPTVNVADTWIFATTIEHHTGPYHSKTMTLSVLQPENGKESHLITAHDYDFLESYSSNRITKKDNEAHGYKFETARLRTGYIQDSHIVLSPTAKNAGTAYLEYTFPSPINQIDIELSYWGTDEGTLTSATADYMDTTNNWITRLNLLTDVTLTTNRNSPISYKMVFPTPITKFRIETRSDVSNYNSNDNSGRICIGSMIVSKFAQTTKVEIINANYNFKKDSYDSEENKPVTVSGTQFSVSKVRAGDITGYTVLSPRRSGAGSASLVYDFNGRDVYQVDFDLAHWREEGKFDNIKIQYWDASINDFVTVTTIGYNDLPFDKDAPKTFSTTFPVPVSKFRILATAPASGSSNDGRIVVSKTVISYYN